MTTKRSPLEIVILAAGKGTRMYSELPKVLHELGSRPLLGHVLASARAISGDVIHVVYGHGGEKVPARFAGETLTWVLQSEQLGTGHALKQAMPQVAQDAMVLVLYGDVPLIQVGTLRQLLAAAGERTLAILTAELDEPGGYGRIVRERGGKVARIVERKDASAEELAIKEINTGFLAAPARLLNGWLASLNNENAQGEYYLTDVIAMAVADGVEVATVQPAREWEIMGVNSKQELAQLERIYQGNQAAALMQQGVTLRDPARFDLRGELSAGSDVRIDINVILEGKVELGDGVEIGPNSLIRDARIESGTIVQANCVIEGADIGRRCRIGPFARIRPETRIADAAHIGNFVELKKSNIGEGSKINHLSYVGDSEVGKAVNIGAGTITCNYDGVSKHRTIIGDNVFIGSGTQLVAPVTVGDDAFIGAGSTISRDAPSGELTLSRVKQQTVGGWRRPKKGDSTGK